MYILKFRLISKLLKILGLMSHANMPTDTLTCAMLTPIGRTTGASTRFWASTSPQNVANKIDTGAEEAEHSNAPAVVHKSRSEAEGAFFR